MRDVWKRTFELFRRHLILWVPCTVSGFLMLGLHETQKPWIRWARAYFGTRRSVLGGTVASSAPITGSALAFLDVLALVRLFVEVFAVVIALVITSGLVHMLVEGHQPEIVKAIRQAVGRYREAVFFSLKYMVGLGISGGILIVLGTSPLTPERFHQIALLKLFSYPFFLICEACVAWLLMPSAIRLLRAPGSGVLSLEARKIGTVFVVATSAGAMALQFLIGRAEVSTTPVGRGEYMGVAAINTVLFNLPQVILFIALSLLAVDEVPDGALIAAEPELT